MYTRDFGGEEPRRNVPEAYCGSLFAEEECEAPVHNECEEKAGGTQSVFRSLFSKGFDLKAMPFLKKGFGTEEILIIGIAAFLLFSKDGDKECAIILLLSLFLT